MGLRSSCNCGKTRFKLVHPGSNLRMEHEMTHSPLLFSKMYSKCLALQLKSCVPGKDQDQISDSTFPCGLVQQQIILLWKGPLSQTEANPLNREPERPFSQVTFRQWERSRRHYAWPWLRPWCSAELQRYKVSQKMTAAVSSSACQNGSHCTTAFSGQQVHQPVLLAPPSLQSVLQGLRRGRGSGHRA